MTKLSEWLDEYLGGSKCVRYEFVARLGNKQALVTEVAPVRHVTQSGALFIGRLTVFGGLEISKELAGDKPSALVKLGDAWLTVWKLEDRYEREGR